MRFTIAKRLWLSFAVLFLVLFASGAISYLEIQESNRALKQFLAVQEPLDEALMEMELNIGETAITILRFVRDGNRRHIRNIDVYQENFESFLSGFKALATTASEKQFAEKASAFFKEHRALSRKIIALAEVRHTTPEQDRHKISNQLKTSINQFEEGLSKIRRVLNENVQPLIRQETQHTADKAIRHGTYALWATLAMTLFALLTTGTITLIITRSIIGSVRDLKSGSDAFGRGNLDHRIEPESDDELKEVATAFNEMAEKRQRAEQLVQQSADQIKLFSYSISHDLKSPAMGIHGLALLLEKQSKHLLDEKGKKTLQQITKTATVIEELVTNINTFISSKETPLDLEQIDMNNLLTDIREEFVPRLEAENIRWTQPDRLPEITADQLSLSRILRNLVDNALKYGGEKMNRIAIDYREDETHHIFSVADNGAGLKDDDLEGIFEVFKRKKSARGTQGSGLGLAIVKEILSRHGGDIRAEPVPDGGIKFSFGIAKNLVRIPKTPLEKKDPDSFPKPGPADPVLPH